MNHHVRILVVEDDSDTATSLRSLLEKNHFRTHVLEDPLLALDIFKENPLDYALIIYDVTVRYMSAFEFLRQVREKNPDIKFILITTIEIKPSEFRKFLPTIHIDGFVEKYSISNNLIPAIQKMQISNGVVKQHFSRRN